MQVLASIISSKDRPSPLLYQNRANAIDKLLKGDIAEPPGEADMPKPNWGPVITILQQYSKEFQSLNDKLLKLNHAMNSSQAQLQTLSSDLENSRAKVLELERNKSEMASSLQRCQDELESERQFLQGSRGAISYHATLDLCRFADVANIGFKWTFLREDKGASQTFLAVLGNKLTGKTFLLSTLLNLDLPRGFGYVNQSDLSVLFPLEGVCTCSALDCRGFDDSIIAPRQEKEADESQFIASLGWKLACYCANVIVIMVDQFRTVEQSMIRRIAELSVGKQLLVVHNLMHLKEIADVEKYINSLKKNHGFQEFKSDGPMLISSPPNEGIRHRFFAREESSAGKLFNIQTRRYIMDILSIPTEAGGSMLVKKTREFLIETLPFYVDKPFSITEASDGKSTILKLTPPPKLKSLMFSEMESFQSKAKYPYDIRQDGKELVLRVELPGIAHEDIKSFQAEQESDQKGVIIHIHGHRRPPVGESFASTIKYGDIEISIPPIKCLQMPKGVRAKLSYEDGMLSCRWELHQRAEGSF